MYYHRATLIIFTKVLLKIKITHVSIHSHKKQKALSVSYNYDLYYRFLLLLREL